MYGLMWICSVTISVLWCTDFTSCYRESSPGWRSSLSPFLEAPVATSSSIFCFEWFSSSVFGHFMNGSKYQSDLIFIFLWLYHETPFIWHILLCCINLSFSILLVKEKHNRGIVLVAEFGHAIWQFSKNEEVQLVVKRLQHFSSFIWRSSAAINIETLWHREDWEKLFFC